MAHGIRFREQRTLARTALWLASLVVTPALAQSQLQEQVQPEVQEAPLAVEDIAEDEEVADIEASQPRQTDTAEPGLPRQPAPPAAPATEPATPATGQPAEEPAAKVVAPNIDLKEVAPPPEVVPETVPEPGAPESEAPVAASPDAPDAEPSDPPSADTPDLATTPPTTPVLESEPEPVATSLTLLGSEVLPGTSTRLAWAPGIQIAGLSQPTPVLVVNGANPGPTLCLTGAIHGDELNGIEIVRRTVYDLDPDELSGRVIGIPIVNLQGFQRGSRYLPDRRDLNRHFPGTEWGSLADRIAHSLYTKVILHCDLLVDIHTGSLRRTNLPQLRADMNVPAVAEFTRGFGDR